MADDTKIQTNAGMVSLSDLTAKSATKFFDINAATITVSPSWQGQCVRFLQACTVTIPADLPDGFDCGWSQESAGQITFQAGNGATLQSVDNNKKSSGQYALGGMSKWAANTIRLYGSLAA